MNIRTGDRVNLYKVTCEFSPSVDPPELFFVVAADVDEVIALMTGQRAGDVPIRSIEKMFATRVIVEDR